ncbi:MAG: hypothetical protein EOO40_00815 [Deltaproteobacteria bacterium]|nr:MAG: hypothetical protein EOO40_00815 [Deltaproteobacteria bacterium]
MQSIKPVKQAQRPVRRPKALKPMPKRAVRRLQGNVQRVICQGRVPQALYLAVRDHLVREQLQVQDMLTWALDEYLRLHAPEAWRKLGK